MCFELMIPVNNKLAFVRGCHADFVWDEFASHNESCHQYVDDVTVIKVSWALFENMINNWKMMRTTIKNRTKGVLKQISK